MTSFNDTPNDTPSVKNSFALLDTDSFNRVIPKSIENVIMPNIVIDENLLIFWFSDIMGAEWITTFIFQFSITHQAQ